MFPTSGFTPYKYIAAGAANQDSILVSAGTRFLYGIAAFCTQSSIRYLKIYDKATAPTSADTPILTLLIPGNSTGSGFIVPGVLPGMAITNGIGFRLTTGLADNDTGAVTANDCVINLLYK